jgi:hypothetical protein
MVEPLIVGVGVVTAVSVGQSMLEIVGAVVTEPSVAGAVGVGAGAVGAGVGETAGAGAGGEREDVAPAIGAGAAPPPPPPHAASVADAAMKSAAKRVFATFVSFMIPSLL